MSAELDTTNPDDLSLLDILLFIKDSFHNIIKSTVVCLTIGVGYFFEYPNMYEATATIQMAMVAGTPVESPAVLLEKIKLPLYFSPKVWDACDTDEEVTPSRKVAERIKPVLNKSAPFIGFTVQAPSLQDAKACLSAVIADVQENQNEIAQPILNQKKMQLAQLQQKLEVAEEFTKLFPKDKATTTFNENQFSSRTLYLSSMMSNAREVKDLRSAIADIDLSLQEPNTKKTSLATHMYAPEFPVNKRPVLTFALCLILGVFIGFFITGLLKVLPDLKKQMREARAN